MQKPHFIIRMTSPLYVSNHKLSRIINSHQCYAYIHLGMLIVGAPVPMAALSKASTVFGRSKIEIAVSNPARGMDVSAFLCVVLSCVGRGLGAGLIPRPRNPTKCLRDP
jgi:hypothetical protein